MEPRERSNDPVPGYPRAFTFIGWRPGKYRHYLGPQGEAVPYDPLPAKDSRVNWQEDRGPVIGFSLGVISGLGIGGILFLLLMTTGCETIVNRAFHTLAPIIEEELGLGDGPSDKGENPPGGGHGKGGSKDTTQTPPPTPPPDSSGFEGWDG